MYESYYKFSVRPFQLKPDPDFFFASKGHKRAMSYLEYGLSQGEGFIVITGEVGAGKTTLMRYLFRKLEHENIVASQIVNTHIDANDILSMVAAAYGLAYKDCSKGDLLIRLEQFLRQCEHQGKRALLVVDEAQNLTPQTIEELRMLSNFQTADKSLLQIFLLGQPEFRATLQRDDMLQLRQRITATYHLGPLDVMETREYIQHRLYKVGWKGDPVLSVDAYFEIYKFSGGIPRKINSLCDRLFLLGFLEERHIFRNDDVAEVIRDIHQEYAGPEISIAGFSSPGITRPEFSIPADERAISALSGFNSGINSGLTPPEKIQSEQIRLGELDDRLSRVEQSVTTALDSFKKILIHQNVKYNQHINASDKLHAQHREQSK